MVSVWFKKVSVALTLLLVSVVGYANTKWECLPSFYRVQYPVKDYQSTLFKIQTKLSRGNNLGSILLRYKGISSSELISLVDNSKYNNTINFLRAGRLIESYVSKDDCTFVEARIKLPGNREIRIFKEDDRLINRVYQHPIRYEFALKEFSIRESLFYDGNRAGVSDRVLSTMEHVFSGKFDFATELRKGDQFRVLYEKMYSEERFVGNGKVIFVEYKPKNKRRSWKIFNFLSNTGKSCYLNQKRQSMSRYFIRSPVRYKRISSGFSLARKHPILHKIKAHRGVDFAAPKGTPVRATAKGVIHARKRSRSFGNVIYIRHGEKYTTIYAHLSRFDKSAKVGKRVEVGQVIGYVGKTGLATGYHLHYELLVNNKHQDPLKMKLTDSSLKCDLSAASFVKQRDQIISYVESKNKLGSVSNVVSRPKTEQ